jgi:hypothetical protein
MPKTQPKHQLVNDDSDYDLDNYYADTNKKSDLDNTWLIAAAGLLAGAFVTQSLNPTGSIKAPNLVDTPISVESIPEDTFSSIMNMDIAPINIEVSTSKMEYIYSQDELNQFKQMGEDLRQYGRIEDPKSIENTAFRNAEQSTDRMGMFTDMEAYKSGALDNYIWAQTEFGATIQIPWDPTGANTCDECWVLADAGPYSPDNFPEPPHYGCQCNDLMAEPTITFPTGEGTVIPLEA